jgi:hypothetical protein
MNRQISHSDISLDWLEAEYVYQPKPVISNVPKEWSIADIDDSDFANAKVKMDSKAIKEKKAKMKTQVKAMKGMIK